jgi:hypothetical protein
LEIFAKLIMTIVFAAIPERKTARAFASRTTTHFVAHLLATGCDGEDFHNAM